MTNPIKGYRELDPRAVDLINRIKDHEARTNALLDEIQVAQDIDQRCRSLAATHIETGFMFLVKSVAQPERLVAETEQP